MQAPSPPHVPVCVQDSWRWAQVRRGHWVSCSVTDRVPHTELKNRQQQMLSGHLFGRGMDVYTWITHVNLHKSVITRDRHGSKRHQILLANLRPSIMQSLGTTRAQWRCHAEPFLPHQLLAACLLVIGTEDAMWPGLLSLSKITIARYGCSPSDVYTDTGHK